MLTTLADFCNVSYSNMFLLLVVGIVFRFVSSVYDNNESNGVELSIALMSRIGCFICIVFSCIALFFNGRNLIINSYNDYKVSCRDNAYDMLGGINGFVKIEEEFASLDMDVDIPDIDNIDDMTTVAKQTVVALSEKEMQMLNGIGD